MSKGIKQFNRALRYANTNRSFSKEHKEDVKAVKKYLDEREELEDKASFYEAENKRLQSLVDIFQNAITIIKKPMEIKAFDTNNKALSMLAQTITEIQTNDLDIRLRETLRKWVLDNAFPKEVKALEIIKKNLVVGYDKEENGKSCLTLCVKIANNNLVVIYETFNEKEIELLREVFDK